MQHPNPETVTLNDILITEELSRHASRTPNLQAENQAMRMLIHRMTHDVESLMQTLVDTALELCQAGTTGLSLLETTANGEAIFRWTALAGTLAHHVGGSTPRDFSPCGVCLGQGVPVLFSHPERYFTYFQEANTPVVEGLVLPLMAERQVFGTIWIMSHDEGRHFDAEDVRIMTSLADFTATALLLQQRQTGELLAANAVLETEIVERKQVEAQTQALIANLPGGAVFVVDRDLRYLLAEGEAFAAAGYKPEDFVGRTIFEVLPSELATQYEGVYRRALAGEPFETEHNSHNHWYITRGIPLHSPDGEVYAVLAVSFDITERKRAEAALRESEEKYRSLFNSIYAGFCVIEVLFDESGKAFDYRFLEANPAFKQLTGWEDVIGKTMRELVPHHEEYWFELYGRVALTGISEQFENEAQGIERFFDVYAFQIDEPQKHKVAVLFNNITDRKRREANLTFLANLMNDVAPLATAEEVMEMVGKRITEHLDLSRYMFVEIFPEAGTCTYLFPSHPPGQLEISGSFVLAEYHTEEEHRLLCAGHSMIVNDVRDGTRTPEQIASFEVFDIGSIVNTPYLSNGRWVFDLGVARSKPSVWREDEIELLRELSARVWLRIERARAEASLRESEEKYRSLFNSMDEGFHIIELIADAAGEVVDYRFLEGNPAFERLTGLKNTVGRLGSEVAPQTESYWLEAYDRVARTGEPMRIENYSQDTQRWYAAYASRLGGVGSRQVAIIFDDISDRKRREQRQAYMLQLSDALRPLADPLVVQEVACRVLGEHLGANRVLYSEMFEDLGSQTLIRVNDYTAGVPSRVGWHRLDDYGEFVMETWRAGRNLLWSSLDDLPNLSVDERAAYEAVEIEAIIGVPLIKEGRFEAFLAVHQATPRQWTADEIALVEETAERTWAAVERARAEEQLHRLAEMDAFRVKLSDALRSLSDAVEIQATVTRTTMEFFRADRCYYCEIIDGSAIIRRDASQADLPSVVGAYPLADSPIFRAMLEGGQSFVFQDVHTTNVLDENLRQTCIQLQIIAGINVPVIKQGEPAGILVIAQTTPRDWTQFEMDLAEEIADRAWATIERTRAEAALREAELQRVREQAAREQERQRAESLADLDRAKTAFFSNVSHEFRTPLTLLLAPLQDALRSLEEWESGRAGERETSSSHPPTLSPSLKQQLQLAHRNALRLLKLVNTLLDFSRIEAGRMEANYEPTDLAQFTIDLASVFRSAIERAGLRLSVDCPPLPAPVYVDREMWEKIILNLLSNALKFTFEGEITVSLRAEPSTNLQASTSNTHPLTSEPQHPSSELEPSSSELETLTSELELSSSELQTSTSELKTSTFNPETSTSELETSHLHPHTPTHPPIILQIRDTGTGIAPEHLPHLFERFYQVRGLQARTHEGSGIGLALVHELVRLQGGTIAVSSTVGQGTCFTITLPFGTERISSEHIQTTRTLTSTALGTSPYVEEAERWLPEEDGNREAEMETWEEVAPIPHTLHPTSYSARVLIVDDNADMRQYLTRILSEHVQVEAVADGTAALAAVQTHPPDLVLSDVMMPRLNGFGLLQTLRANPRTREIPVILLSARAGEEAIAEGLDMGADDYLIKPFSAQELIARVNAHLQIASLRGEALHEAKTAIHRKDELLSVVSHELNTPLVSILGWTRLLRANPSNSAMLSTALETIERSATMQAKLVQDLLDVSRITAGKLRLNLKPTDLESVIEAAIATVTQLATEAGIHLTWAATTTAVVMGDRERLQQVVCNLLTNAIKFTPEGGQVEVRLSLVTGHRPFADNEPTMTSNKEQRTKDNYAEICVTDTGVGIAADFLPYVFEQFRQAEGQNSAKGLGLGLTIAHHIVELHHGTIQAQSAGTEQGATFTVRLPLLKANH